MNKRMKGALAGVFMAALAGCAGMAENAAPGSIENYDPYKGFDGSRKALLEKLDTVNKDSC